MWYLKQHIATPYNDLVSLDELILSTFKISYELLLAIGTMVSGVNLL